MGAKRFFFSSFSSDDTLIFNVFINSARGRFIGLKDNAKQEIVLLICHMTSSLEAAFLIHIMKKITERVFVNCTMRCRLHS